MILDAVEPTVLAERRQRLAALVERPVVLWAGRPASRNFPANVYPFRASSHFLYFAGLSLPGAAIALHNHRLTLFMDNPSPASILWHGPTPSRDQVAEHIGADAAYPLERLADFADGAATIAVQDLATRQEQATVLGRPVVPPTETEGMDRALVMALVQLRLGQDAAGLADMRRAIAITVEAHKAGMAATRQAHREAEVRAAIEAVMTTHQAAPAYTSIVTVRGEVLHSDRSPNPLTPGDLLLVDAGAEIETGWASDITRTWPVSGQFSPTQRAVYDVVLAAHDGAIAALQPGIEYRDIHLIAAKIVAEGLVDLGILRGTPESLVEQDLHAFFFPHGIGHLLGLDVHDLEDFGDLAGYAPGRTRSSRFGLGYLRLDRPLQPGMVVTIEPGFYQVAALLQDAERREQAGDRVNWERLADFADVQGIRIEDDVLVTETGSEVLSAALPTAPEAIEELVQATTAQNS